MSEVDNQNRRYGAKYHTHRCVCYLGWIHGLHEEKRDVVCQCHQYQVRAEANRANCPCRWYAADINHIVTSRDI